jgi:NAD(P)-dependent dehydrogenase (short-subunit alcohol dehydrogenase family)
MSSPRPETLPRWTISRLDSPTAFSRSGSMLPTRSGPGRWSRPIGARIATPGAGIYYASKAAVSALAETLALEVAPLAIKVTAVEPGAMRTRFAEAGSLQVAPFDPAYDGTVGATVGMMRSPEYATVLRDPAGGLSAGPHTVEIVLADANHQPLDRAKATFVIPEMAPTGRH